MARIKPEDIDLLRDRADIVEVVSSYTELKKSGPHSFKGLCPFHSEKTPSFSVDSARNMFHCFGCQEGGNVYHFVMKVESLPFPEAVEWLARKSGFDLHYEEARPGEGQMRSVRLRLLEANKTAAEFWHKQLTDNPDALEARRYLEGRGFGREVAERWQLGWAPGRDETCKHLMSKGFTADEIKSADLARVSDRDGSLYDGFRQRIIFPTWNLQDEVVGFGARAMGDAQPKYLNTAETPVFSKSRVMYGLNRAKSAIARGSAVVVEGYTDVIALHEAGIKEAVATNGVALGESHFELLKKFSSRAVLMFDSDAAGAGATERGFGMHHRIGLEVLVAPLEPGRDPADVAAAGGAEALQAVIASAQPLLSFKLRQTLGRMPLDTPEAKARAVREAAQILRWHPDPIARHEYAFSAAEMIGVGSDVIHRSLSGIGPRDPEGMPETERALPGHVKVEREMLQLLLLGRSGDIRTSELAGDDFTSTARRELFEAAEALERKETTSAAIAETLSPAGRALFSELTVGVVMDDVDEAAERARELARRLKVFRLDRQIKVRVRTLQEINPLVEGQRHDDLFTELVGLEASRRDLLKQLQGAL